MTRSRSRAVREPLCEYEGMMDLMLISLVCRA